MSEDKKLWGGRFSKGLDEDVQEFNNSIRFDKRLARHDIRGSIAHVNMLAKIGLVNNEEKDLIVENLNSILDDVNLGKIEYNDSYEDIHMNVEKLLHIRLDKLGLSHVGAKLHTARSRNDQVALDTKLYLREATEGIIDVIDLLILSIERKIEEYRYVRMPAYTHLQKAQPVLLSTHLGCWQEMLKRDIKRYRNNLELLDSSPLGAGALAGSTIDLDRNYVAEQLGFSSFVSNTMDAVSDRDYVIDFCSSSAIFMVHLSRICEELIIWSSSEFSFIYIDDAYATGSSLMPNKKNPDVPELIRGKSGRVCGNLVSILMVMKSLPLAYNKDMQEDKEVIFDSEDTVISCGKILSKFIGSISFDREKLDSSSRSDYICATYIVDELVMKGVPFRIAHEIVGNIIKYCEDNNRDIWLLTATENKNFNEYLDRDMKDILLKYYK